MDLYFALLCLLCALLAWCTFKVVAYAMRCDPNSALFAIMLAVPLGCATFLCALLAIARALPSGLPG